MSKIKNFAKKHEKKILIGTTVVVGVAGAAAVALLATKNSALTRYYNAAFDVIQDLGGDATELISDKLLQNIGESITS